MKLFKDLKYVLQRTDCEKCKFKKVCDRDIFFNEEGHAIDICMILRDIEEELMV